MKILSTPHRPASRSSRRRAALRPYLSYLAYAVLTLLALSLGQDSDLGLGLRLLSMLALISMFVTGVVLLRPARLGLPHTDQGRLDERQQAIVNASQLAAYRITAMLLTFSTLYLWASSEFGLPLPEHSLAWAALSFGVTLLVLTLPTALLAWTEPDGGEEG